MWILTGDKVETARNIAYSCALLNKQTEQYEIGKDDNGHEEITPESIVAKIGKIEKELKEIKNRDVAIMYGGAQLAVI